MFLPHQSRGTRRALVGAAYTITLLSLAPAVAQAQAQAQEPTAPVEDELTTLAKLTQNPVADLISIPLRFNFFSGGGLGDRTLVRLDIEPVLPIHVTEHWNVIARAIVPLLSVPEADGDNDTGLGDIVLELFVSPSAKSSFSWGVGPILSLPTATVEPTATGSWGIGPAATAVYTAGRWVLGALATQTWTFADYGDDRDIDQLMIQPFVHYNFGKGWAASTSPMITARWNDDDWTVPIGAGLSWTTRIGGQAMNLGAHYYYNLESPDDVADNQLRFEISFLFPRRATTTTSAAPRAEPQIGASW